MLALSLMHAAMQVLLLSPANPKALYRRCVAYSNVGDTDAALADAKHCLRLQPKNAQLRTMMNSWHGPGQSKIAKHISGVETDTAMVASPKVIC